MLIYKFLITLVLVTFIFSFQKSLLSDENPSVPFPIDGQCVLIYFDESSDPEYQIGEVYSLFLQNLLGHFPEIIQIVSPVERYEAGEIEKCRSTLYIGSYFDNAIPESFYSDFAISEKPRAWLGYNIWNFDLETQKNLIGHTYSGLTTMDTNLVDEAGKPHFYKTISYKGEQFHKFGEWVERDGQRVFAAPFEQVILEVIEESSDAQVLATAVHTATKDEIPYAIRNNNFFYLSDVPFSYAHESDRYLVFSDLLFDILDLEPRHKKRLAVMRMEDVHPLLPLRNLHLMLDVFKKRNIPIHIALVPIFYDPLFRFDRRAEDEFLPMTRHSGFMDWIRKVQEQDGVFIWHGSTHQYTNVANPHSGYTGDDFEFWDAVNNKPVELDSVNFVLDRLDLGMGYLAQAGIFPKVWLTPHYQASALNYYIFADVFEWNIGRAIYFKHDATQLERTPEKLDPIRYNSWTKESRNLRRDFFKDLKVETSGEWFGQLYPYEIYGDIYGQRLIPEILGNPQPFTSNHVWYPRSLDQIVEDARRNLVLRDSWASLFFHPYILTDLYNGGVGEYPGDTTPLEKVLDEIQALGYDFINLEQFSDEQKIIQNALRIIVNKDNSWEIKK